MPPLKPLVLSIVAALLVAVPARMPAQSPAQSPVTTVILVRHAEKADEPGADPALSAAGEARARALADALRGTKVAAVLTTPYKRTNATGALVATANGLSPIVVPVSGGVPAYASAVADIIRTKYAGQTVVVVGHSNTLASVIAALGGPKLSDLCDNEYSTMYRLTLEGTTTPKLATSHYGAADADGAAGCRGMGGSERQYRVLRTEY